MIVKGITIHNTGNGKSAREVATTMQEQGRLHLCHFLVDENEILQTLDPMFSAEHTGKGYDNGNMYTIAIEICRSTSEEDVYLQAQARAIEFIKELMGIYGLTADNIYFHRDFNPQTYCPHRILQIYGNKQRFIEEVF